MLFHYVNRQRNADKNVKLNVTYLISGVIFDEILKQDIHKVCVVDETKLSDLKETFKRIFSVHFYSVQKAQLHDLNVLYVADYDKVKENIYETSKYSGILCPSILIRSSDEINSLKSKLAYKSSSPTKSFVGKEKSTLETKPKVVDVENKENKFHVERHEKLQETELQHNLQQKKNAPKGSKGGIASMFAIQKKKNEDKKASDCVISSNIKVHKEEDKKTKKGALSCFFTTTGAVKPRNKDQNIMEELHMNKNVKDNFKMEVKTEKKEEEENPLAMSPIKIETKDCVKSDVIANTFVSLPKQAKKASQNKPKISATNSNNGCRTYKGKRKPNKEASISNNKRRRIMAMDSSSESSCEETEELDEDPMPAPVSSTIESDDEDVIPPTPENSLSDVAEMAKVKKRKLVTKTFMDEHGFFVTKKEYELTSDCSDEENPLPSSNKGIKSTAKQILPVKKQTMSPKKQTMSPKKINLSPKKKTSSPPKKRKSSVNSKKKSPVKRVQASITSFFKRN